MNDEIETILDDPAASDWLRWALRSALRRDPVDAAADAEVLAKHLKARADEALRARAGEKLRDVEYPPGRCWIRVE